MSEPQLELRCARARGHSIRDCACRTATGWLPCPPAVGTRGWQPVGDVLGHVLGFTGDECGNCGKMQMIRSGTCLLCIACGTSSECA